jgi:glycosyltransferase involved in cell wall biosynthesis
VKISVVVCTHNRRALLEHAVRSLAGQDLAADQYEVIVVDNASTDGTREAVAVLQASTTNLLYVYEPAPGLSNARNAGVRDAHGEIVAFLDDDAQAEPGWLTALVASFDGRPRRPLCAGGPVVPIWERLPPRWLPDFALASLSIVDYGQAARELDFPREWLAGCNMAFDRDFLLCSGGFDPRLGRKGDRLLGNEELAAFRAVVAAGGVIRYEPAAAVRHLVPASRVELGWFCRRMYAQGVSNVILGSGLPASGGSQVRALLRARSAEALLLPVLLMGCYTVGVVTQTGREWFDDRRVSVIERI